MNKKIISIKSLLVIFIIIWSVVLLVHHFHIDGFQTVVPEVLYTSEQPRGMDYMRLVYKYHIASMVNVRQSFEHISQNWHNEEVKWTHDNGIKYFELPVSQKDLYPTKEIQDKFLEMISDKTNLPILLHGSRNDKRVAMLTALWLKKNGCQMDSIIEKVKIILDEKKLTDNDIKFIKEL